MNWQIRLPYRHRSDLLPELVSAAHVLPTDEDRAIVRQLVLGEIVGGQATTVGELLDKLEAATPEERRKMLDTARAKAGLKTASEIDVAKRMEAASGAARLKAAYDHRPLRLAFAPSGAIIDLNEADDDSAREAAQAESRRQQQEAEEAVRAVEAEAIRAHEQASRGQLRRELPQGFPL